MRGIWRIILPLALLAAAGAAPAQYTGGGRPPGRGETLERLAQKADTAALGALGARFAADSAAKRDSLEALRAGLYSKLNILDTTRLAAGSNIAITHGANHTYTIAATGGGAGGSDSIRLGDLMIVQKGFGDVRYRDDSTFADTLERYADSLAVLSAGKSIPMVLYLGPGLYTLRDTVLGPRTGARPPLIIQGMPDRTVVRVLTTTKTAGTIHGHLFSRNGRKWANVTFREIRFENPAADSYGFFCLDSAGVDDVAWEGCEFALWKYNYSMNSWTGGSPFYANGGTGYVNKDQNYRWRFEECRFDSVFSVRIWSRETVFERCRMTGFTSVGFFPVCVSGLVTFDNCTWDVASYGTYTTGAGVWRYDNTSQFLNCTYIKRADYYYGILGIVYDATVSFIGCKVLDPRSLRGPTTRLESALNDQGYANPKVFKGCFFERSVLSLASSGAGSIISGCAFTDSSYIEQGAGGDKTVISGNEFYYSPTAISLPSGCDNCVVVGNSFVKCGTGLSDAGTGTVKADNNALTMKEAGYEIPNVFDPAARYALLDRVDRNGLVIAAGGRGASVPGGFGPDGLLRVQ
jgi:hypothetical protein